MKEKSPKIKKFIENLLKPNLLKIILAVVIFILSIFGGYLLILACDYPGCSHTIGEGFFRIIAFIPTTLAIITNTMLFGFLVFNLIYSYLLSCLIIYLPKLVKNLIKKLNF